MRVFGNAILLTAVLMLYISAANAASFDVSIDAVKDRISISEFAKFNINVKNNLNHAEEFRIYTPNFPTWDLRTEPIVNPITLTLAPGEEGSVEVLIDPLKIRDVGTYGVIVNVRAKNENELRSVPVEVSVLSTQGLIGGYVPTVTTSVGVPEKIDPRENIPIKVVLNNQNIIDYSNLEVKIESKFFSETIETSLEPKGEKTIEIAREIDPLTAPQEDFLTVSLIYEGQSIISPIVKPIEIIEYGDLKSVEQKKGFLVTREDFEFVSNNPDYDKKVRLETGLLGSIFSTEEPKADIVKVNGQRYMEWDVSIEDNSMHISVTKNFIPLIVVIALIAAVVFGYYMLRSPLEIRKESANVSRKEGGISEMSIIIHISNRGKSKVEDIEITETIPGLVAIEREVSIGSLQPSKVMRHEGKGTTVVKWNVDSLDVAEERVLSYKLKSKLSILGSFSLPSATAIFKTDGKTMSSRSNRLNID